ncbi:RNA 2',3'-cyclic phosphodiesterase [Hyphomonas sp. FCG-A18]|uniref:RNA 2',3'-cyclic phosphodiesterase n=1 Tax=Hyphomonas sp. FCG-A18 TaxID=3080019 RepID=UPI002B293FE8|nr:RNA 2',3'-cyclic phosphodiesterase [Hyphomonas sp. FCG-A18]
MHRLFAALPVPDLIAERVLGLSEDLPGARWRQRDHLHITLHFYGEVHHDTAEEIANRLEAIRCEPLELELSGVGWFGRKAPHNLHALIAENPALTALAKDCRKIARTLGLKLEDRPFKPHITLAYCKDTPLDMVRHWSETFQTLRSNPFLADTFHLYESFTSKHRQSQYVPQADYALEGGS